MRQVLFQIPTNLTLPWFGGQFPVFGMGLLLGIWLGYCAWWAFKHIRERGFDAEIQGQLMFQTLVALVLWKLPAITDVIKIYGYGAAMVGGFLVAAWLAGERARREGIDPTLMWDIGMTVLFSGVIGARLFFIIENPGDFFGAGRSVLQVLMRIIDLPSGGLVLYGGVLMGIGAYIWHCRRLKMSALKLADILMPSIFVGEMFGRIGCFLNGCCYGDPANPDSISWLWAVTFPAGSVPFNAEVAAGVLDAKARCSLALHPAQIYSSLNAFVLALITWNYFPRRARDGAVLALGWILYPISRFCLEIVRGDTLAYPFGHIVYRALHWGSDAANDVPPAFNGGPDLTTSQWVSIAMLIGAIAFSVYLSYRPRLTPPATDKLPEPPRK